MATFYYPPRIAGTTPEDPEDRRRREERQQQQRYDAERTMYLSREQRKAREAQEAEAERQRQWGSQEARERRQYEIQLERAKRGQTNTDAQLGGSMGGTQTPLSRANAMTAQGLVRTGTGQWVTPQEAAEINRRIIEQNKREALERVGRVRTGGREKQWAQFTRAEQAVLKEYGVDSLPVDVASDTAAQKAARAALREAKRRIGYQLPGGKIRMMEGGYQPDRETQAEMLKNLQSQDYEAVRAENVAGLTHQQTTLDLATGLRDEARAYGAHLGVEPGAVAGMRGLYKGGPGGLPSDLTFEQRARLLRADLERQQPGLTAGIAREEALEKGVLPGRPLSEHILTDQYRKEFDWRTSRMPPEATSPPLADPYNIRGATDALVAHRKAMEPNEQALRGRDIEAMKRGVENLGQWSPALDNLGLEEIQRQKQEIARLEKVKSDLLMQKLKEHTLRNELEGAQEKHLIRPETDEQAEAARKEAERTRYLPRDAQGGILPRPRIEPLGPGERAYADVRSSEQMAQDLREWLATRPRQEANAGGLTIPPFQQPPEQQVQDLRIRNYMDADAAERPQRVIDEFVGNATDLRQATTTLREEMGKLPQDQQQRLATRFMRMLVRQLAAAQDPPLKGRISDMMRVVAGFGGGAGGQAQAMPGALAGTPGATPTQQTGGAALPPGIDADLNLVKEKIADKQDATPASFVNEMFAKGDESETMKALKAHVLGFPADMKAETIRDAVLAELAPKILARLKTREELLPDRAEKTVSTRLVQGAGYQPSPTLAETQQPIERQIAAREADLKEMLKTKLAIKILEWRQQRQSR